MSENKDGSGKTLFPAMGSTADLKRDIWNEAIEAAALAVQATTMEFVGNDYKDAEDWVKVKAAVNIRSLKK